MQVSPRAETRGLHLPIDFFFRSLAEDQKTYAVGIVLSGTGSDGAQGVCEIKAMGGITFAQDERSAKFSGMPHSAAESGCADLILEPQEIARRLAQIRTHPYLIAPQQPRRLSTTGWRNPIPKNSNPGARRHRRRFQHCIATRRSNGASCGAWRCTPTNDLGDYIPRLENDPEEVKALYHDLLINVTSFFRDPALFDALKERSLPGNRRWQAAVSDDTRLGAGLLHRPGSLFDRHELDRVFR